MVGLVANWAAARAQPGAGAVGRPMLDGQGTLRLRSVSKTFQGAGGEVPALLDVSFDVAAGSFVCFVGPSGCGKSTLLNLIAGLDRPVRGQLMMGAEAITGPSPQRVVMFQEAGLFPWLDVQSNVEFGLSLAGVGRQARRARAGRYLEMVGLGGFARAWVHELSGGMKQRVALARALVLEPRMLLMDEPFAALDAQTRDRLLGELQRIWMETKQTIVFVTHNVREAAVLADRVLVFSARPGRVKADIAVDAPRPREMKGADILAVANRISDELENEVAVAEWQELEAIAAHAVPDATRGRRGEE